MEVPLETGVAHGSCILRLNRVMDYKVVAHYSPENDCYPRWNDPAVDIDWPVVGADATLSGKDMAAPLLVDSEHRPHTERLDGETSRCAFS